jgi:hypothetical protein
MEKGLRFGKTNAFLHLHLAEAYLKIGRTADARRQLNAIITMTPDHDYLPEYKEAVMEARKLLEKTLIGGIDIHAGTNIGVRVK